MQIKDLAKRYKSDALFRDQINLYIGAASSLVFTGLQFYGGIRYQSVWFTALAVYSAVLAVVKFYLARSVGKKGKDGWIVFRRVGCVMTILNIALLVMISILVTNPSIALHEYSITIAVLTGVWTLISAGLAVYGVVQMRNKDDPVALADRLVQLTTSIVSVLMLQTALIASISTPQIETAKSYIERFGSMAYVPEEISEVLTDIFQRLATSNSITGVLVAIFTIGLTAYIIIRGTVEGKRTEKIPVK